MDTAGRERFLFPLGWPGGLGSLGKPGPGLLARAQEGTLPVTLLREGIETPGDPDDAGVEAASSGEALITADAWEAAVHPILGFPARALAGICREAQVSQPPYAPPPASASRMLHQLRSCPVKAVLSRSCLNHTASFRGTDRAWLKVFY